MELTIGWTLQICELTQYNAYSRETSHPKQMVIGSLLTFVKKIFNSSMVALLFRNALLMEMNKSEYLPGLVCTT